MLGDLLAAAWIALGLGGWPQALDRLGCVMQDYVTLYRPVGPGQLAAIIAADWRAFPSQWSNQPFFFPLMDQAYAERVAQQWNVHNSGSGFVLRFRVCKRFLADYEPKRIGGPSNWEYRIPAAELAQFNQHIMGTIELVEAYFAEQLQETTLEPRVPLAWPGMAVARLCH